MKYTREQIEFLRVEYQRMNARDLTRAFNRRFKSSRSFSAIRTALVRHGIRAERKKIQPKSFTPEQIEFLKENYQKYSRAELLQIFNERFPENQKKMNQLLAFLNNQKIRSGRTGCFAKGITPWNKGKRGYMGPNRTSFKPGQEPPTARPLWHERVGKDGYIEISVPEQNPYTGCPRRFRHKHNWIWEQHNGPVPEGHVVMFADADKRNFDPDNLILVSRAELLIANLHSYRSQPKEIKPVVLSLAKLEARASFRTNPGKGRRKDG